MRIFLRKNRQSSIPKLQTGRNMCTLTICIQWASPECIGLPARKVVRNYRKHRENTGMPSKHIADNIRLVGSGIKTVNKPVLPSSKCASNAICPNLLKPRLRGSLGRLNSSPNKFKPAIFRSSPGPKLMKSPLRATKIRLLLASSAQIPSLLPRLVPGPPIRPKTMRPDLSCLS